MCAIHQDNERGMDGDRLRSLSDSVLCVGHDDGDHKEGRQ